MHVLINGYNEKWFCSVRNAVGDLANKCNHKSSGSCLDSQLSLKVIAIGQNAVGHLANKCNHESSSSCLDSQLSLKVIAMRLI